MTPLPEQLLDRIRSYAAPFANHPPEILNRFPGGGNPLFPFEIGSDRGMGILLLCAALYRPGAETRAGRVVAGLYSGMGDDIFRLNRLSFETLKTALSQLPVAPDPEEQKRVPGILRSVCDFFYRVGSLPNWLGAPEDWEKRVQELSEAIYWMGRHSSRRVKARYFIWLASFQSGFGSRYPQARTFRWPAGEGHARFYRNILPPSWKKDSGIPDGRLGFFASMGQTAFPEEPWRLFPSLDAYLRPEKEHEYLCRKIQGGCRTCPLEKFCAASKNFGVSTPLRFFH